MHTNAILFLNTISRHIMSAAGIMIKNWEIKCIEDGIKQVNNLYLQRGFNITHIHADSEFVSLGEEMDNLGIPLNCGSKK